MFKKGDIVKGKPDSGENEFIEEADVLQYDEEDNLVELMIIKHEMDEDEVGETEWYDADDFTLVGVNSQSNLSATIKSTPVVMTKSDIETALILGLI